MFSNLATNRRNQMVEVCRYFFRCNVMRNHLLDLLSDYPDLNAAVEEEWDEFWAYYTFWLSGLWVVCEGIERIGIAQGEFLDEVKAARSRLHPVRQATFHYKPDTSQMMRHFESGMGELTAADDFHQRVKGFVAEFLQTLPEEYIAGLGAY